MEFEQGLLSPDSVDLDSKQSCTVPRGFTLMPGMLFGLIQGHAPFA